MFAVLNKISGNAFMVVNKQKILTAALDNGLNFPYGCQNGFCGKCKATIIDGQVAYEDGKPDGISAEEVNDNMALLCQCHALSNVTLVVPELDDLADIKLVQLPCKVDKIKHLNSDVVQVLLKIPDNQTLQYSAGQYIDLIHPDFDPRSFSIANAPSNNSIIELHIRLIDDGKFTYFIFNQLKEKSLLKIEGPKGDFYLREGSNKPIILLAGGTGFGPIKAMVEHAIQINLGRQMYLYWGARDEVDLYTDLPKQWARDYQNISFVPVLSDANKAWQGRTGYVHESVLADFDSLQEYEVYACGPPQMIESAVESFVKKGMLKDNFFSDAFEFAFMSELE